MTHKIRFRIYVRAKNLNLHEISVAADSRRQLFFTIPCGNIFLIYDYRRTDKKECGLPLEGAGDERGAKQKTRHKTHPTGELKEFAEFGNFGDIWIYRIRLERR